MSCCILPSKADHVRTIVARKRRDVASVDAVNVKNLVDLAAKIDAGVACREFNEAKRANDQCLAQRAVILDVNT